MRVMHGLIERTDDFGVELLEVWLSRLRLELHMHFAENQETLPMVLLFFIFYFLFFNFYFLFFIFYFLFFIFYFLFFILFYFIFLFFILFYFIFLFFFYFFFFFFHPLLLLLFSPFPSSDGSRNDGLWIVNKSYYSWSFS